MLQAEGALTAAIWRGSTGPHGVWLSFKSRVWCTGIVPSYCLWTQLPGLVQESNRVSLPLLLGDSLPVGPALPP